MSILLLLPNLTMLDLSTAPDSSPNDPFPNYIYISYIPEKKAGVLPEYLPY